MHAAAGPQRTPLSVAGVMSCCSCSRTATSASASSRLPSRAASADVARLLRHSTLFGPQLPPACQKYHVMDGHE